MASKGTRNTAIAFGDYEITVAMFKAETSRDPKFEKFLKPGVPAPTAKRGSSGATAAYPAVEGTDGKVRVPVEELEAIEEASKAQHATMRVLETIDYRQVPTERITGSYWLQPRAGTAKGLALLAHGLKNTGRVAVVKWVSTSREKLGVIRARTVEGKLALLLSELVFANDFTGPDEDTLAINDVELTGQAVHVAERLVKSFARDGEHKIDTASDTAVDGRIALVERLRDQELDDALAATAAAADGELAVKRS
jgi:non-homologous end joining protein Ku